MSTAMEDNNDVKRWTAKRKSTLVLEIIQGKTNSDEPKPLPVEAGSRLVVLAICLDQVTLVLGTRENALAWMMAPATGLNQRKPLDLLKTPVGAELVFDLLGCMEYGVYS